MKKKQKAAVGKPKPQKNRQTPEKAGLTFSEKKRLAELRRVLAGNSKEQAKPDTAQKTITFKKMYRDGICQVADTYYTKMVEFFDINYDLLEVEDQADILEEYSKLINYFDPSIRFQLFLFNRQVSEQALAEQFDTPLQDDDFNDIREEYTQMLKHQSAKGNNGIIKSKYIIFGVESTGIKEARSKLSNIEKDVVHNLNNIGTNARGVQKDEKGNIYRWDPVGHGEYKSPIPMKWSIVINGQEKPIEQWTEYITAGTVGTKVVADEYMSTVTFKLAQPLPDGAEIRATSLHTLGNDDGVQYNKSNKEYGKQYGSLKISNDIIDPDDPFEDDEIEFLSGVKRGQDYFFSNDYLSDDPDNANTQNQNYERDMKLAYQDDCHWFWRVREITSIDGENMTFGEWTKYRKCRENSRSNKKLNAEETRTLIPDKRYQVEIALLCISKDSKTLYWPYDSSVIANGTGFEGYRIGWDSSKKTTPKYEYAQTFNIGRASAAFQLNSGTIAPTGYEELVQVNMATNGVWYQDCYKTYGTFEHPLSLKNGDWFEVNLAGYAIESGHYQNNTLARVQKLESNTWVEVNASSICETIEDRKLRPLIKNIKGSAKGTYRVSFKLDTYDIYYWDETSPDPVWDPQYRPTAQSQQYLLCGSNGSAGYIYFTIE